MAGTVPASSQSAIRVTVSNQGHFYCLGITGTFTTLYTAAGPVITDDGTNHLRGQLFSDNDPIFNDFVPFDLFLSPGRRLAYNAGAPVAGTPSNALFVQFPLEYLFPANSIILMNCINDGSAANSFDIAFIGIRCAAYEAVSGVRRPAK
jgi:hypothetical protein